MNQENKLFRQNQSVADAYDDIKKQLNLTDAYLNGLGGKLLAAYKEIENTASKKPWLGVKSLVQGYHASHLEDFLTKPPRQCPAETAQKLVRETLCYLASDITDMRKTSPQR